MNEEKDEGLEHQYKIGYIDGLQEAIQLIEDVMKYTEKFGGSYGRSELIPIFIRILNELEKMKKGV